MVNKEYTTDIIDKLREIENILKLLTMDDSFLSVVANRATNIREAILPNELKTTISAYYERKRIEVNLQQQPNVQEWAFRLMHEKY